MAEGKVYDTVGLLQEASRYKTSIKFLDVLYREFYGNERLLSDGLGARLLAVGSALPSEFCGWDINPGSVARAEEFVRDWKMYKDVEPFLTEFDFLKRMGIKPSWDNCHFSTLDDFGASLEGLFDGEFASELLLHLNMYETGDLFSVVSKRLKPGKSFVFTMYPAGFNDSLDEQLCKLGSVVGLNKEQMVEDGEVNVELIAEHLREDKPMLFHQSRERYWLDLSRVRVFSTKDVVRMADETGFVVKDIVGAYGGMFSMAHRYIVTLTKN